MHVASCKILPNLQQADLNPQWLYYDDLHFIAGAVDLELLIRRSVMIQIVK